MAPLLPVLIIFGLLLALDLLALHAGSDSRERLGDSPQHPIA
jgi:hypothetical protein